MACSPGQEGNHWKRRGPRRPAWTALRPLKFGRRCSGCQMTPVTVTAILAANSNSMALQFWKPGTTGPGSSLDRESEDVVLSSAMPSMGFQRQKELLPIFKHSERRAFDLGVCL